MACEIMPCCRFFIDSLKYLPKTAEYIQQKLCLGDYESCNRFMAYKEFGKGKIPSDLYPFDAGEIKKVMQCLRERQHPDE